MVNDKAQEISGKIWQWYKKTRDAQKNDKTWEILLNEVTSIINQYDDAEYDLAKGLYLDYLCYIERKEGVYSNVERAEQKTITKRRVGG